MIDFYNAFISYKHADLDTKVAEHVQRNLERFRIPGKIKKKTGRKKIERIFRDKDELPITSDLTDTISNALEKAEYLIVICSPNTKQSIWVRREIQFFLRNHTKNQILTVLAGGEPQDVIPEELLSDERMVENEMGIKTSVKVPIEPLSCDYRMPFKKAKSEELPRLASALIGCSYDELVRRQRQYKMRRLGIIGAAVLAGTIAFGGYMLYSKMKIDKSYREQLVSQSRYLANESEKYLEDGQRIEALQLALAALPKDEDDDRPVTPEAVRAITEATKAYTTNSGLTIDADWNYQMPNIIESFDVCVEGTYLVAKDRLNNIMVWDTTTHQLLLNKYCDDLHGMSFLKDKSLMLWNGDEVENYTLPDGNRRWNYVFSDQSFQKQQLMEGDDFILMQLVSNTLAKFEKTTGKLLEKIELPDTYGSEILSYNDLTLSPNQKRLACECYVGSKYALGIYDLTTKRINVSATQDQSMCAVEWGDDEHVLTATPKDLFSASYSWGERSFIKNDINVVACYNPNTMIKLWSQDMSSIGVMRSTGFVRLPANNAVCFYHANAAAIYDCATGTLIHGGYIYDSIVSATDLDGDGWPVYVTRAGGLANPLPSSGTDAYSYADYFSDEISSATVNGGVYVCKDFSTRIIHYKAYIYDEDWKNVDENLAITTPQIGSYIDNDVLFFISGEENGVFGHMVDPVEHKLIRSVLLNETSSTASSYDIMGRFKDEIFLTYRDVLDTSLVAVDINTGNIRTISLDQIYYNMGEGNSFADGKYACVEQDENTNAIEASIYDLTDGKKMSYTLEEVTISTLNSSPEYLPKSNVIYVSSKDADYIVDIDKAKVSDVAVPGNWSGALCSAEDDSGSILAVADNNYILILNKDGSIERQISTNGMTPLGLCFHKMGDKDPMTLYVVYNNRSLYRYDPETGAFIGSSYITTYDRYAFRAKFTFDDENKTLMVRIGELCDVIETNTWIETICVNNCYGYCEESDEFYATNFIEASDTHIGYFKHYSIEDLKKKATDTLQGVEPSEDLKSVYGI